MRFLDARRTAFDGLIDYAGLFPPASLGMAEAVAGFRSARAHPSGWMVRRFVCPIARLDELAATLVATMQAGEQPWPLSLLTGGGDAAWRHAVDRDTGRAVTQRDMLGGAVHIDLVEVRIPHAGPAEDDVEWALDALRRLGPVPVVFEIPPGDAAEEFVVALAEVRRRRHASLGAKLRCGGLAAADFPSPERVADVIAACRDHGVPLKATAGLHHPFRHRAEDTGFVHHGFVNLLAASALAAVHHLNPAQVAAVVADGDPASFTLSRRALRWRDLEVDEPAIRAAREGLFLGYGSCDFAEPVADLERLGVLPVEVVA